MAGVDPGDLHALAQELLEASVAALNTIPDTQAGLAGAPDRSFISAGEPVADCCPQLTVHVSSLAEATTQPLGLGAGRRASYSRLNHVALFVTIFRCVTSGTESKTGYKPPLAAHLENDAVQINADGWALWNHLFNRIRAGLLFSTCREVFYEGGRQLIPSGLCGGWVFAFRVQLDGYEEDLN